MARYACVAWAVLLAACVDLSQPPELKRGGPGPIIDPDAAADEAGTFDGVDGAGAPDLGSNGAPDLGVSPPPDADPGADAPEADAESPDSAPLPPDLGPPDAPLLTNGSSCTAAGQCQSGLCVDNFCCNAACNGLCQACDVAGSQGRCTPIKAGDDPDNECALDAVATCGRDGSCDGSGACRRYPVGMVCAPGSCAVAAETGASTCSNGGTCQAGATKMCTGGHTCTNGSCSSSCNGDGECQTGFFCDAAKTCQVKRVAGAACTAANQCASTFCVDGVCCNIACDQTCYACNLAGSVGTCNPLPDGQDATPAECPGQDVTTCGRKGGCNGRGACRFWDMGASCAAQTCTGAIQTDGRTCNGSGVCAAAATHDCGAYLCAGNGCASTCTTSAQCKAGYTCTGTTCRLTKIITLVVHDTVAVNVPLWGKTTNFQIGMNMVRAWGEDMWKDSYVASMDTAGNVFLGKEWIKVATESKKYTGGPQATVTLAGASDVYLIIDDRWGASPSWLSGWSNTGIHLQVSEANTRMFRFTAYKKAGATGSLDLPKIGASTAYNYFVIVD
jgi:hypothetical protein